MEFDVVVVGGGPAGAAMALTLTARGVRVALAGTDARRARNGDLGETLSAGVTPCLQRLGVAGRFRQLGLKEVSRYSSSWGAERLESRSSLEMYRGCGWLLERAAFEGMLLDASVEAGCLLFQNDVVQSQRVHGRWRMSTREGKREIRAQMAVFATGRSSGVLRPLNRPRRLDRLVAFVAALPPHEVQGQNVRVAACPGGWAYSAPSGSSGSVVAFFTDADVNARTASMQRDLLLGAMRALEVQAPEGRLSKAVVRVVSCTSLFLPVATGDDWVACGDAAQTVDPLSAMGIRNAIDDAIEAGEVVLGLLAGRKCVAIERELARRKRYLEYLTTRAAYYRLERRWAHEAFWARRHDLAHIAGFVRSHGTP